MTRVTIRQIESFLAVAEAGNFSSASRRLNIAQPALSQSVKELETELGIRLFDRTTRRVELTQAGQEFRNSTGKVLEDIEIAVQNARELADRRRGRIRIAAPPLLAAVILPLAIAEFRRRHPGISIEVADVGTERIMDYVLTGRVDCGLGTFPSGEDGVERVVLMRDSLMLFCAGDDRFSDTNDVPWSHLVGQPLITLTSDSGIRLLVEVGYETAQLPLKPAFEVSLITTALALVEAGLGVAVLPTYALSVARSGKITGRPLVEPCIAREVVLIRARGRAITPALSEFIPVLRRYARKLTPQQSD